MLTIHEVLKALPWSEPKEYKVRGVPKLLKRAEPSEEFYKLWRAEKSNKYLRKHGVTMKWRGKWMVHWWSDANGIFWMGDRFNAPIKRNE